MGVSHKTKQAPWRKLETITPKRKPCYLYIFRHAQTHFNKQHRFTGWKDSMLTPLGIRQARKVANMLKTKKIDVAFHSHLSRSKDTLKAVLKHHPECKIIIEDDRIIERSYGNLQGKTHKSFVKKEGTDDYRTLLHLHKIDHLSGKEKKEFIKEVGEAELKIVRRSYNVPPPKGESVKMVEQRVNYFIKDLLSFMKKNRVNVAISAHGNSMRPLRKHFEKLTTEQMMHLENPWDNYFVYKVL